MANIIGGKNIVKSSSYVDTLWPLLLILRGMGCFPLRLRGSGELQCSAAHVGYSVCMLATQLVVTVNFVHQKLKLAHACDLEIIRIGSYINISFLSIPMILAPLIALQAPAQLKFFKYWNKFQVCYEHLSKKELQLRLQKTVWIIITFIVVHTLGVLLFRPIVLQDFPNTVDILHIVGMGYEFILLAWWHITCKATCHVSQGLIQHFHIFESNATNDFKETSKKLHRLWLQLFHLIEQFGSCMCISQGVLLVFEFANLLLFAYYFIIFKELEIRLMFIVVIVLCGTALLIHCRSAHTLNVQVQNDIFKALELTKNLNLDNCEKQKLMQYFSHLVKILPKVDLHGYLKIGRGLLAVFASALVSSLVILIQLNATNYEFSTADVKNSTCKSFM